MQLFSLLNIFCLILQSGSLAMARVTSRVEQHHTPPSQFITESSKGSEHGKSIRYRVILPPQYPRCPNKSPCYGTVYFLHGRNNSAHHLEELGATDVMHRSYHQGQEFQFIIVSPDGGNNYWMNAARERQGKARWASFVVDELIRDVESKFHVRKGPEARLLAGISMGGHGALQISMNFPGVFGSIAAHSPVLRTADNLDGFEDQFGEHHDYEARDPLSILRHRFQNTEPFFQSLWLDIGRNDFAFPRTLELTQQLEQIYSKHSLLIDTSVPAGHDTDYWRARLPEYFQWYQSQLQRP